MGLAIEEAITNVAAPSLSDSAARVCEFFFFSKRFFVYSMDSCVVFLAEKAQEHAMHLRAEAKRNCQFDIWQIWQLAGASSIRSVRFNHTTRQAAVGSIAVVMDEGKALLLVPQVAPLQQEKEPTAGLAGKRELRSFLSMRRLSSSIVLTSGAAEETQDDYVRMHLGLQLPTWKESVRWKSDDRHLCRLEWVPAPGGNELFLIGAGSKISIWKIVDDAAQVYFQRSFGIVKPENHAIAFFDTSQSGRFLVTCGANDQIVKVWEPNALAYDGTPNCVFMGHRRSLRQLQWSNSRNSFRVHAEALPCEMLFCLQKGGKLTIWKETVGSDMFVIWKEICVNGFYAHLEPIHCANGILPTSTSKCSCFGLVNHHWVRSLKVPTFSSITDALLDENNVLNSLCLFHFGSEMHHDTRCSSIYSQRMDEIAKMNSVLLGERSGFTADNHVGELVIDGNTDLAETFNLHLMFSLQDNGEIGFYRIESCHFTGSSPRVSLAFVFSGMKEQLADADIYGISCADAKGKQHGSYNLTMEILFQPRASGRVKLALLKLNTEASSFLSASRKCRSVPYSVQSVEVANMCDCVFAARAGLMPTPPTSVHMEDLRADMGMLQTQHVLSCMNGAFELFRANLSFSKLCAQPSASLDIIEQGVSRFAYDPYYQIVFLNADHRLFAAKVCNGSGTRYCAGNTGSSLLSGGSPTSERLELCFADEELTGEFSDLLLLRTPSDNVRRSFGELTGSTLLGLTENGRVFVLLSFEVEMVSSDEDKSSFVRVNVRRRQRIEIEEEVLKVLVLPSFAYTDSIIGSVTKDSSLVLWKVIDGDRACSIEPVHRVDLIPLMNETDPISPAMYEVKSSRLRFKSMAFSRWGRVAVLFDDGLDASSSSAQVVILRYFEQSVEDVVTISQKRFGHVVGIEWSPPVSPESACDLIFLTTNVLGVIKRDSRLHHHQWQIVSHTTRFDMQPRTMSSLAQYPRVILGMDSSLALLSLADASLQSASTIAAAVECDDDVNCAKVYHAHHPLVLLFLLMRGQFCTLQLVLDHIQTVIVEHEKTCYLNMTEGKLLRAVPLIPLATLLKSDDALHEERSKVYRTGQPKLQHAKDKSSDRAADLFALGNARPTARVDSAMERAENLFAPLNSTGEARDPFEPGDTSSEPTIVEKANVYAAFFNDHRDSLSFYSPEEREMFLALLEGLKTVAAWQRDTSRQKDEPSLHFLASLSYPSGLRRRILVSSSELETIPIPAATTRAHTESCGITSEQVVWALLSDHQSELLQECCPNHMTTWTRMKNLRLPYWVKDVGRLRLLTEKVAQAEYASTRDPFQVAIFYVLLGKTKLLANLFKLASEHRIYELLSNNFDEERWQHAAIKNAYVLKAKQRYELSAAFFLLGQKVQEAMSIAEYADHTLVLPFLIARLSENRSFGDVSEADGLVSAGHASDSTKMEFSVTRDFLQSVVCARADKSGDIYGGFLVKYLTETMDAAIDILLTIPQSRMDCIFAEPQATDVTSAATRSTLEFQQQAPPSLYWSAFAKSLVGASEIVRFLRNHVITSPSHREKAVRSYALTCTRMLSEGFNIALLFQFRDTEPFVHEFRQDMSASVQIDAFCESKRRVLIRLLITQVDWLCSKFEVKLQSALKSKNPLEVGFCIEDSIEQALQSVLKRGCELDNEPTQQIEVMLRSALTENLVHTQRLVVLDFVMTKLVITMGEDGVKTESESNPTKLQRDEFLRKSTLPTMIEHVSETISFLSTGNLASGVTDEKYTKMVDQKCGALLRTGKDLLRWLCYYYSKSAQERSMIASNEFVRIATAAVYSVIGVCSRYANAPCCVYRSLALIFPHKEPLPKRMCDELKEIATADVCVHCTACQLIENPTTTSLQHDLPLLYHVVGSLEEDLEIFISKVKTNRLNLMARSSYSALDKDTPPLFEYCQYWSLMLIAICNAMPGHITKIAVEMAPPGCRGSVLARTLVSAWTIYSTTLSKYGTPRLLQMFCEAHLALAKRPDMSSTDALMGTPANASSLTNPTGLSSVLACNCEGCPWLMIINLFVGKDEFLVRLNTQLQACGDKISDGISWGHLQEIPSRNTIQARSHKSEFVSAPNIKSPPRFEVAESSEKRSQVNNPACAMSTQCIYRSEVSIKSMCFNRVTETNEMILCASKGICRTACADASDDSKFQFKGMYAHPQAGPTIDSPATARKSISAGSSGSLSTTSTMSLGSSLSGSSILAAAPSSEQKTPSFKPTTVRSHPFLPLFVSGNQKGQVHLWSYDSLSSICHFPSRPIVTSSFSSTLTSRRDIKKIRFDALGQQMGAVDVLGNLFVWKFSNLERQTCYQQFECHDKVAKSLTFLNSGSCLATVGTSSEKKSVCIWDTLLPSYKSLVCAPLCHSAGAASVVFSSIHQLLISGGEGGSISVFDMRQRRVLHTISAAHETCVTTLALHPSATCMLSGSASGDVKIWSVPVFREIVAIPKVHAKPSFLGDAATNILGDAASNMAINVTNSSWGVTDACATVSFFFSSGTDGSVQRYRVPEL